MKTWNITLPITGDELLPLQTGDRVSLTGTLYTARDEAHEKLLKRLAAGETLPIPLAGAAIYYAGPCPAKPGRIIGPVGPTTSGRMDGLTLPLLQNGLKVMVGKGPRSADVVAAIAEHKCVYLAAIGGAGALLSQCVKAAECVAFPELGPEAIYRLTVEDFPAVVAVDPSGRSIYAG